MRVSLFSTAVLLLTLIAAGSNALACDCMTPPEPERFKRSDVVFEGDVIRVIPRKDYPNLPVGYVFRVAKILKGDEVTEITIARTGSNCDADFTLGYVYRVYAFRYEGNLRSGLCSGNKLLSRKKKNTRRPNLVSNLTGDS